MSSATTQNKFPDGEFGRKLAESYQKKKLNYYIKSLIGNSQWGWLKFNWNEWIFVKIRNFPHGTVSARAKISTKEVETLFILCEVELLRTLRLAN